VAGHDTQVLKGILSMLLLRVLAAHEDYGYSVVVRLRELGFEGLAEGTVYPALTRLEGKGLLASRLVASAAGPARKYYRPTEAGRAELDRATGAWIELSANVDRVMARSTDPNQHDHDHDHDEREQVTS
jgi:PadR family transcriptional regulator, regulatory protein PadR